MHTREDLNRILQKFLSLVAADFPVRACFLFGSYAKGCPSEYSDIDVAIVSDIFAGNRFRDRELLAKHILQTSYDLEVHPFKTENFTTDDPIVKEIIETGIRLIPPN